MPTLVQKPILHGRDHGCGGADPIPGICDLLSAPSGTIDEAILATEPDAYYKLDESSGDWADSADARDAAYISRTGTVRGVDSGLDEGDGSLCVTVEGSGPGPANPETHVGEITDGFFEFAALAPFSVTARVRIAADIGAWGGSFSLGICGNAYLTGGGANAPGFGLFVEGATGKPFLRREGSAGISERFEVMGPTDLELDTWYRLTGTFDGSTLSAYLDDTHLGDTAASGGLSTGGSSGKFRIGCVAIGEGAGGTFAPWIGELDSVAVWDRALSAGEVGGIAGFETGAVGGAGAGTVPTSDGAGGVTWSAPTFEVDY